VTPGLREICDSPAMTGSDVTTRSDVAATKRRGRLPRDERERREHEILDHALAELGDKGVDGVTMLGVAKRAGASKETLYSWFGNRHGLLATLIARNADRTAERVAAALEGPSDPHETLSQFAAGLLALLTGDVSIALNRAAMTDPELARLLLESGRLRVGPIVEEYLASLDRSGQLAVPDPAGAFELLYGLVVADQQIRTLLGDDPPTPEEIANRSTTAIDRFFRLFAPTP